MITIDAVGKKAVVISGPYGLDKWSKSLPSFPKDGDIVTVLELSPNKLLESDLEYDKTFSIRDVHGTKWYIAADNLEIAK